MTVTRDQVVAKARSYIGLVDDGYKTNEFTREWGINGLDYCAAFVSSIFWRLGSPLPSLGVQEGFLYVPYAVDYARETGQALEIGQGDPAPGDIALFTWSGTRHGGRGEIGDHTGIVEEYPGGDWVVCVEGNTVLNGRRGIHRRTRHLSSVACFWRPTVYDDTTLTPASLEDDMPIRDDEFARIDALIARGATNTHVAVVDSLRPYMQQVNANLEATNAVLAELRNRPAGGGQGQVDPQAVAQAVARELLRELLAGRAA